jgi:hypothetical protein
LIAILWLNQYATSSCAGAGFLDRLGLGSSKGTNSPALLGTGLGEEQVIAGLKEALANGLRSAVANLGREGGFLTNLSVKIPMPEKLQKVEQGLRAVGQSQLADEFVTTMNRAAEKAVPLAADVFADSLKQMTLTDARNILNGTTNAATQFFERTTRTNLYGRFMPIVQKATSEVGVTQKYKEMTAQVGGVNSLGGLLGSSRPLVDEKSLDLDGYVTNKALDGLFKMVAVEEARIRANPLARTTDLLKKVFSPTAK